MPSRVHSLLVKAGSLSWREWLTLMQAFFVLPVVWVGLRLVSLPRLMQVLSPGGTSDRPGDGPDPFEGARRSARLVQGAAGINPLPSSCLSRSVTLWWLLRRRGVPAEIRLGVQTGEDGLAAHAWVEVDGRPVNDATAPGERFAAFTGELMPRR